MHNVGVLNDRELLSSLRRAEHGRCYASLIELMQHATERGLTSTIRNPAA